MENRGLLFIPDISGFTRFVHEAEIEHSRLIIQELLELLINANELALEISEIEGDAILFYKFGASPNMQSLYKQVETMFCDFHRHLNEYEQGRYCQCMACASAVHLTLKVISHYGEFTGYTVKNFSKLIGRDVIVAHQLLKNDIAQHEYWLVTQNLTDRPPAGLAQWVEWKHSVKQTETGEIPFYYTHLGQLKKMLPAESPAQPTLADKTNVLSGTREYNTDMISLFHATGDPRYRNRWQVGVKAVEGTGFILPRVGMRFRMIGENDESLIRSSSCRYQPDRIEFSETDESKNSIRFFTLEKKGENKTMLTIDYYVKKETSLHQTGTYVEKQEEEAFHQSLQKLEAFVNELRLSTTV